MVKYIDGIKNSNVLKNKVENCSWYDWMTKSSNYENFDYLYLMHDDIFFLTENFDQLLNRKISTIENVGIINLTDLLYEDGYYKSQTRHGFYIDRIYNRTSEKGQFAEFKKSKTILAFKKFKIKKYIIQIKSSQ